MRLLTLPRSHWGQGAWYRGRSHEANAICAMAYIWPARNVALVGDYVGPLFGVPNAYSRAAMGRHTMKIAINGQSSEK